MVNVYGGMDLSFGKRALIYYGMKLTVSVVYDYLGI